ncbi:MAG: DUF5518 domain-containing protein [Halapricum sp.]
MKVKASSVYEFLRGKYKMAVLAGIASIPFTLGVNWAFSTSNLEALSLFIACAISGFHYESGWVRAGTVTALVGGIPILIWQTGVVVTDWWGNPILVDAVGDSWSMGVASVGAGILTFGVSVVILLIIGVVGGGTGEWVHSRIGSSRQLQPEA